MALPQIQNPLQKRTGQIADALPTQVVRPDPMVGGANPAAALAMGGYGGYGGGAPATPVLRPGEASPDVNPQSAGTRFGNALGNARRSTVNLQTDVLNTATKAGAGLVNAGTYLPRATLGFARDVVRGAVGAAPSPTAGQPTAGLADPVVLQHPFIQKPVNFVTGGAPTGPGAEPAASVPAVSTAAANYDPAADNISQANLAVAKGAAAPVNFGGVKGSATTVPQIKLPGIDTGVDVGGRHLNYGSMVNGVPTFSDGTGGAGAIPRTMSDASIKDLGNERSLGRADAGALSHVLAGDVTGTAPSTDDQVATLVRNATVPITGSRPSAAQFAEADRNAIAMRDPRSAAGTAARNLSIEAGYAGTPRLRRMAETALANLHAGTQQSALAGQQAEAQAADTAASGRNALDAIQLRGTLEGQNTLANTALEAKLRAPAAGQLVQAADGSYTLVNPSTAATTAVLQDGKPLKGLPKNPPPPIYTSAGGQAALQGLTNNILGVDPLTGMVPDKNAEGGRRLPTNAEQFAAMQKAQQQLQQLNGGQASTSTATAPPAQAVAYLQQNPQARADFDQKYGAGAAARALGQ